MTPHVSIIIPNYNHKPYLQQRLDTVFNQSYQNFEVILLDDASTDGSQAILKQYQNHPKVSHLIINSQNSGSPFKQWQKGINAAKGEWIWIAESDDYCELNFLEQLLSEIDNSIGVCYSQSLDVDETGNEIKHRIEYTQEFTPNIWETSFKMSGYTFIKKYLLFKNVIPNASAVVFKKELVTKETFTDDILNMQMCGDWFFWVQLVYHTQVGFVAVDLNYFRNHKTVSRKHDNFSKKKLRLLEERTILLHILKNNPEQIGVSRVLYKKWFKIHSTRSLFSSSFYEIKLPNTSIFTFLKLFCKYRF